MMYFNIIKISTPDVIEANRSIHLSWWPIVSLIFSITSMLVTSLTTSKLFEQEWLQRVFLLAPVFAFRLVAWQLIIILLADRAFLAVAAMVVLNYAVIFVLQKDQNNLDPLSAAILSFLFPTPKLDQNVTLKMFVLGNVLLMISLAIAWSSKLHDWWRPDMPTSIYTGWIDVIFWSSVALFLAATVPLALIVIIPW
jgi:hypothetical protein